MDEEKRTEQAPEQDEPPKEPYVPASRKKRIAAWIGVAFMLFLTIMYAYSIATGAILWW